MLRLRMKLCCESAPSLPPFHPRSIFITPLSPRPSYFISLAAALAAPLVCYANDRQPAYQRDSSRSFSLGITVDRGSGGGAFETDLESQSILSTGSPLTAA
jgi:hypothetical protein